MKLGDGSLLGVVIVLGAIAGSFGRVDVRLDRPALTLVVLHGALMLFAVSAYAFGVPRTGPARAALLASPSPVVRHLVGIVALAE